MKCFNYLNLPKIEFPKDFKLGGVAYHPIEGYKSFNILSDQLISQILEILPKEIAVLINPKTDILYQTINPTFNNYVHKDGRAYAINYLIKAGGENVETLFFDDDKCKIETNVMQEHTWASLHTNTYHCVTNITEIREAITISFGGFPNFQNLLNEETLPHLYKLFYDPA